MYEVIIPSIIVINYYNYYNVHFAIVHKYNLPALKNKMNVIVMPIAYINNYTWRHKFLSSWKNINVNELANVILNKV